MLLGQRKTLESTRPFIPYYVYSLRPCYQVPTTDMVKRADDLQISCRKAGTLRLHRGDRIAAIAPRFGPPELIESPEPQHDRPPLS